VTVKIVPPLLLAHVWTTAADPTGWWMSEKLDGVRAYWDGKTFRTRLGGTYDAPEWFTEGLPDSPLDGELWAGRGNFLRAVSIVKKKDMAPEFSDRWTELSYVVFDLPGSYRFDQFGLHGNRFEERQNLLSHIVGPPKCMHSVKLEQTPCKGLLHLREELAKVEAKGGEGLMLRQPGSLYEPKRSRTLLKVKTFLDAEATVISYEPGKGKHTGRMGAVNVRTPDGREFSVGTGFDDKERENPPPIGCTLQYSYQELSKYGIPRFPVFLRIREEE
jgi:DNA ligase-1